MSAKHFLKSFLYKVSLYQIFCYGNEKPTLTETWFWFPFLVSMSMNQEVEATFELENWQNFEEFGGLGMKSLQKSQ